MLMARKLLLCVALASVFAVKNVHTITMFGFNYSLLKPLIARAKQAINDVSTSLRPTRSAYPDARIFSKYLYKQQKNSLKLIKAELKQTYKAAKFSGSATWFADKQLYKAFKKLVYKSWKKTRLFPSFK